MGNVFQRRPCHPRRRGNRARLVSALSNGSRRVTRTRRRIDCRSNCSTARPGSLRRCWEVALRSWQRF
jgi:hypothetical protein